MRGHAITDCFSATRSKYKVGVLCTSRSLNIVISFRDFGIVVGEVLDEKLVRVNISATSFESSSHLDPFSCLPPSEGRARMYFEPEDTRLIPFPALVRDKCRIYLEEDVVKRRTKIGTIYRRMPGGFGVVDVFATGAVKFDRLLIWNVGLTQGQERL